MMARSTAHDTVGMYVVRFLASNHVSPISCQSRPSMLPARSPVPPRPLALTAPPFSCPPQEKEEARFKIKRQWQFCDEGEALLMYRRRPATLLFQRGFSVTVIHTLFNTPDRSGHPHFRFVAIDDGLPEEVLNSHDILAKAIAITKARWRPFMTAWCGC
ncbi:hypothetical protein Taro_054177 [Colocasia esculenta]|uniref:Uncharacterized protein n=1 Tax=Colocasia esculenta TaxID=4460 RepID=A0A843XPQ1_COLES|nr:hypothetical protein [Colocasia esculenta]